MKYILLLLLISNVFFGQTQDVQEKYLKERGYIINPNTYVTPEKILPPDLTPIVIKPGIHNQELKTNSIDSNENKVRLSTDELSYYEKLQLQQKSTDEFLNSFKDNRINLTEYEYDEDTENNTKTINKYENYTETDYSIIYIVLIIILVALFLWWSLVPSTNKQTKLDEIINKSQQEGGKFSNVYKSEIFKKTLGYSVFYESNFPQEPNDKKVFSGTINECHVYVSKNTNLEFKK